MATPPLRTEISDTYPNPSDAVARVGFGKLYDYIVGLLGSTGNSTEARTALSAAKIGANSDITSISTISALGNTSTSHVQISTAGSVGIGGMADASAMLDVQSTTKGVKFPSMTKVQKDAIVAAPGLVVYDTTLNKLNVNDGANWGSVGGGATGGLTDDVFHENANTVTSSYTISTGKNAGTFGPIAIDTGVTVTIPTGSTWTII